MCAIERTKELRRRRQRRGKVRKLKARLAKADDREKYHLIAKIRKVSPSAVPAGAE